MRHGSLIAHVIVKSLLANTNISPGSGHASYRYKTYLYYDIFSLFKIRLHTICNANEHHAAWNIFVKLLIHIEVLTPLLAFVHEHYYP